MMIADAQVHIWQRETPERPWPSGRYLPPWAHDYLSADALLRKMDEAGVDRVILVPPSFEGDRNELSLEAAAAHPDRFRVMGRLALDAEESRGQVRTWLDQPGMVGIRLTFFTEQQRTWLTDGTADWFWAEAADYGVPLMVYPVPDSVPILGRIAARYPALKMAIDHLAMSHDAAIKDEAAFDHLPLLLPLAAQPNIAVKASGLPHYSSEPYPFRRLHGPIRTVIEAFGPRRVFWGTDLTRLPCTYSEAVRMFTESMRWLSDEDKQWVMGRALCEWLNWPVPE